jgi:hypothetical protein
MDLKLGLGMLSYGGVGHRRIVLLEEGTSQGDALPDSCRRPPHWPFTFASGDNPGTI